MPPANQPQSGPVLHSSPFVQPLVLVSLAGALLIGMGIGYLVFAADRTTENIGTSSMQNEEINTGGSINPATEQFANFYCIRLNKDLNVGSGASTGDMTEVKQLQHFINYYFATRLHVFNGGLKEDGIFGPETAAEVIKVKKWPHFESVKDRSSLVESDTRRIITELTCEQSDSITIPIEFSVSAIANDENKTRIIAPTVKEINTNIDKRPIVPGSYGGLSIELENPIDTKVLGVDFSKGNFFSGCDDTIIGIATLSKVKQKFVTDYPAGKALTMSARLDSLTGVKIQPAACGD